jgi:hypothetical protein
MLQRPSISPFLLLGNDERMLLGSVRRHVARSEKNAGEKQNHPKHSLGESAQ